MQGKPTAYTTRLSRRLFVTLLLSVAFAVGCQRVNYPQPTVTKVVGRPGVCQACQKAIESVQSEQLAIVDAVQYVVCDEQCAGSLKKSLEEQKGR